MTFQDLDTTVLDTTPWLRQYVKDGTIVPSLLRHGFILEIPELNYLTAQWGISLYKAECGTQPIVTGWNLPVPNTECNHFSRCSECGSYWLRVQFLNFVYSRQKVFHQQHPENVSLVIAILRNQTY